VKVESKRRYDAVALVSGSMTGNGFAVRIDGDA
jgi:hypothetical protein